MVLVNSRAQQTSSAKQTTSIIKIKVNQSGEAQFFEIDIRRTFSDKELTQETLPCQIPPPYGKTLTLHRPFYNPPGWPGIQPHAPLPNPAVSRWHAHYSYIIIMHVWVTKNNYQLHCLVTAVLLQNRTVPKKILNLQKTIIPIAFLFSQLHFNNITSLALFLRRPSCYAQ